MHKLFLLHSIWINNWKRKNKTFRGIREKNSLFSQRSRSRAWYANVPWVHQRNSRRECFQMLDRDRKVETNRGNYPTEDWNGPQHQDHLLIRRLPMWPQNAREKNRLRRFVLSIFLISQQTLLVHPETWQFNFLICCCSCFVSVSFWQWTYRVHFQVHKIFRHFLIGQIKSWKTEVKNQGFNVLLQWIIHHDER